MIQPTVPIFLYIYLAIQSQMESRGQQFSKFFVVLLLMLFVFALGNIIYNLENLYLGGENVPEFIEGSSAQGDNVATSTTLANAIRWVYFGFLGFMVLTLIIGAVSFGQSKDKKKWRNLFFQMLGAILICAVIIAFGVFYEDIEGAISGGGSTDILIGGGGNATFANATTAPEQPETIKIISTIGIFAFFFSFWAIAAIAIARIARSRSSKLDYSDLDLRSQEVAETIQRTIDALAGGSDTRATVIRCYTDMCKVLAKYGVVEEEHLTPREFEKLAREALPVPDHLIHDLVMVFEEARYSDHSMTEEDSQRAVSALEGVKSRLVEVEPSDDREVAQNGV